MPPTTNHNSDQQVISLVVLTVHRSPKGLYLPHHSKVTNTGRLSPVPLDTFWCPEQPQGTGKGQIISQQPDFLEFTPDR